MCRIRSTERYNMSSVVLGALLHDIYGRDKTCHGVKKATPREQGHYRHADSLPARNPRKFAQRSRTSQPPTPDCGQEENPQNPQGFWGFPSCLESSKACPTFTYFPPPAGAGLNDNFQFNTPQQGSASILPGILESLPDVFVLTPSP